MTECKHEWRLILDDTGGAFRFCSICEQSENEWMNAKPKQCKDCKWFEMSKYEDGHGQCLLADEGEGSPMFILRWLNMAVLKVKPTHGCNAWEAKGQRE